MAWTGIFATNSEVMYRAGKNVSLSGAEEAKVNDIAAQSESIINVATRRNWSDDYSAANADVKRILSACSAAYIAMHMIQMDMSGYTTRIEAEDMINIQRDDFLRNLNILIEQKAEDFMDAET